MYFGRMRLFFINIRKLLVVNIKIQFNDMNKKPHENSVGMTTFGKNCTVRTKLAFYIKKIMELLSRINKIRHNSLKKANLNST